MNKKRAKIKASYEVAPTSCKGEADVELPEEATNELGLATARLIDTFNNSSKKVFDMFCNGMSKLGEPIGEIIKGKTTAIELANQSIYMKLAMTKEANMRKLIAYAAEEFDKKVDNGENIPSHLVETDEILLIEENASMTSNEEFLKLWAKLYTEEACKPGSVSRKTIKLLETLDIKIIKILENKIFPFCDYNGFYWGNIHGIADLLLLQDYGLIETNPICASSINLNDTYSVRLNEDYILYCYPNFACSAVINAQMYRLTNCALEIINNVKMHAEIKPDDAIKIIYEHVNESSKIWRISKEFNGRIRLKKTIKKNEKFVICDNKNNVVYPKDSPFKTYNEFLESAMANIEELVNEK